MVVYLKLKNLNRNTTKNRFHEYLALNPKKQRTNNSQEKKTIV